MAIPHAKSGDVINVTPLAAELAATKTHALLKSGEMELLRLVLPAGKTIAEHKAPGEITVHCLEGHVQFTAFGTTQELTAGRLLHLPAGEPHALHAVEDSSVLVTLLRRADG